MAARDSDNRPDRPDRPDRRDVHYPIAGICVCCGVIWPCYAAPAMPYRIELPVPRQRDAGRE